MHYLKTFPISYCHLCINLTNMRIHARDMPDHNIFMNIVIHTFAVIEINIISISCTGKSGQHIMLNYNLY